MPELPEVETIARLLREQLVGQFMSYVEVRWPRCVAYPSVAEFERELLGREVQDVGRRGKFVILSLSGHKSLLVHLRMTGRLIVEDMGCSAAIGEAAPDSHTHILFRFSSGKVLRFRDTRKFGRLHLVNEPAEIVGDLGPEPLSPGFTPQVLHDLLRSHRRRLKSLLIDQRVLAGLGNIYVDEALWEARIHPLRRAQTLSPEEVERLHIAIRSVLACAIGNQGTTLRDYRTPLDEAGENQEALAVYGRQGKPCRRCGELILREVVGGRGTWYCPSCQRCD